MATYILKIEASDLSGGADFNAEISANTQSASSYSVQVANGATEVSYAYTKPGTPGNNDWDTGSMTVEVNVTTAVDIDLDLIADRIDAIGNVQESSARAGTQSLNSTGVKTFTIPSTNWTAGNCDDRLRIQYEFTSNQGHGTALTSVIETGTSDTEHTTAINEYLSTCGPVVGGDDTSGRNFLQFEDDHIVTIAVGGSTADGVSTNLYLRVPISSFSVDETLTPNIEVEQTGTGFDNTASTSETAVIYNPSRPSNRRSHSVVYDSTRKRMILFGGIDRDGTQYNDVWELRLDTKFSDTSAQWKLLSPSGTVPDVRRTHVAEFDSTANRMIMGMGFDGGDLADWHELDFSGGADGAWASLSITADPSPIADSDGVPDARAQSSSCIDNANQRLYIFAGFGASRFNDLWELDITDGSEQWNELAEDGKTGSPSTRNDPSLIYDSTNTQLVAFGGYNGSARLNDVWFWNIGGSSFAEQTGITGAAPSIRELAPSVYDATNNRMIIWSGRDGTAASGVRNDFFELDLTSGSEAWTDRTGNNLPAFAWGTNSAAYDTSNNLMIIVGGLDSSLEETKHSFALDLSGGGAITLRQLWFNNYLRNRDAMAYAYDEDEDIMLSAGGYSRLTDGEHTDDTFSGEHCNEIWLYNPSANEWFQPIQGDGLSMTNREGAVAIYDTNRNRFILFGGLTGNATSNNTYYNDVWELKADARKHYVLTKLAPSGTPPSARWLPAVCYDKDNDRMVLFGGYDGSYQNDLFELDFSGGEAGAWGTISASGSPPTAKRQAYTIFDETNKQMVIFGGKVSTNSANNELHLLDLTDGSEAWSDPGESGTPSSRRGGIAVYDNNNGFMIIFGGTSESAVNADTYYLDLTSGSEAWTLLSPTTSPAARRSMIAGYDRTNKKMYLYGGREEANSAASFLNVNDTWELDASNATPSNWDWSQKAPKIMSALNVDITSLSTNDFHWQAWGEGSVSGSGTKRSFGSNAESAADFTITGAGTAFTQSLSDTVVVIINNKFDVGALKTETFNFTENFAANVTFVRSIVEALAIAEAISIRFEMPRTEAIAIAETSERFGGSEQALTEALTLSEVKFQAVDKGITITLTIGETSAKVVTFERTLTETLTFVESLASEKVTPQAIIYEYFLRLS